jgi:hypothetical protein
MRSFFLSSSFRVGAYADFSISSSFKIHKYVDYGLVSSFNNGSYSDFSLKSEYMDLSGDWSLASSITYCMRPDFYLKSSYSNTKEQRDFYLSSSLLFLPFSDFSYVDTVVFAGVGSMGLKSSYRKSARVENGIRSYIQKRGYDDFSLKSAVVFKEKPSTMDFALESLYAEYPAESPPNIEDLESYISTTLHISLETGAYEFELMPFVVLGVNTGIYDLNPVYVPEAFCKVVSFGILASIYSTDINVSVATSASFNDGRWDLCELEVSPAEMQDFSSPIMSFSYSSNLVDIVEYEGDHFELPIKIFSIDSMVWNDTFINPGLLTKNVKFVDEPFPRMFDFVLVIPDKNYVEISGFKAMFKVGDIDNMFLLESGVSAYSYPHDPYLNKAYIEDSFFPDVAKIPVQNSVKWLIDSVYTDIIDCDITVQLAKHTSDAGSFQVEDIVRDKVNFTPEDALSVGNDAYKLKDSKMTPIMGDFDLLFVDDASGISLYSIQVITTVALAPSKAPEVVELSDGIYGLVTVSLPADFDDSIYRCAEVILLEACCIDLNDAVFRFASISFGMLLENLYADGTFTLKVKSDLNGLYSDWCLLSYLSYNTGDFVSEKIELEVAV